MITSSKQEKVADYITLKAGDCFSISTCHWTRWDMHRIAYKVVIVPSTLKSWYEKSYITWSIHMAHNLSIGRLYQLRWTHPHNPYKKLSNALSPLHMQWYLPIAARVWHLAQGHMENTKPDFTWSLNQVVSHCPEISFPAYALNTSLGYANFWRPSLEIKYKHKMKLKFDSISFAQLSSTTLWKSSHFPGAG